MKTVHTAFGDYALDRIPSAGKQPLQAWDAADELLLQHLADTGPMPPSARLLVVNDAFAALSCCLHQYAVTLYSDSFLSQLALEHNTRLNGLDHCAAFLPSTDTPQQCYDYVLIRIPKTLALLEHQLATLRPLLDEHTQVIAAGMVKYLQPRHFALFERYLGPITTSLARKKARLIFLQQPMANPQPSPYPTQYTDSLTGLTLSNHANLFSRSRLDDGSRLLIQNLDHLRGDIRSIIDMACGNGVIGIAAARLLQQQPAVSFVDESFMALASSRDNYQRAFGSLDGATFVASNGFAQLGPQRADLIVCNPPFHQANTIEDQVAWQMIQRSRDYLSDHGKLCLVGNRHLNYHQKLKRIFKKVSLLASDRRFVLLLAGK